MRWGSILMCGWPGLARLWSRGHYSSLLVAIGFAVLLNLALISSFLWPTSMGITFPLVAWPTIILVWMASAWVAYTSLPDVMAVGSQPRQNPSEISDTLFIQAQHEYLRGHWTVAESLLKRRLEFEPRDMECRLLLATMLRHSRRLDEARYVIDSIQKYDESIQWDFETRRERQLIDLIEQAEQEDDFDDTTLETPIEIGTAGGKTRASTRMDGKRDVMPVRP